MSTDRCNGLFVATSRFSLPVIEEDYTAQVMIIDKNWLTMWVDWTETFIARGETLPGYHMNLILLVSTCFTAASGWMFPSTSHWGCFVEFLWEHSWVLWVDGHSGQASMFSSRAWIINEPRCKYQVIIPSVFKKMIVEALHTENIWSCNTVRSFVIWPAINNELKKVVSSVPAM